MFDRENRFKVVAGMNEKSHSNSYYKLKKFTQGLPNYYNNPGRNVWTHMEFLKTNYYGEFNNLWGLSFEKLLADSLINFVNDQGKSIIINSFEMNKNCIADYEDLKAFSVDIDILLNDQLAIFSKTTFRERYKQGDRDSLIIDRLYSNKFDKALIFYKEYDSDSYKDTFIWANRIQRRLMSETKVITVYDEEAMYNLFNTAIKRAENNYHTIGE